MSFSWVVHFPTSLHWVERAVLKVILFAILHLFIEKLSVSQTAFYLKFHTDCSLCSAGHLWKVGKWAEGDQHQPGSTEKELSGTDGAKAHPSPDTAVLWWGVTHSLQHTQHTSRWTVLRLKSLVELHHNASWCIDRWRIPTCWRSHRHWWRAVREAVGRPSDWGKPSWPHLVFLLHIHDWARWRFAHCCLKLLILLVGLLIRAAHIQSDCPILCVSVHINTSISLSAVKHQGTSVFRLKPFEDFVELKSTSENKFKCILCACIGVLHCKSI